MSALEDRKSIIDVAMAEDGAIAAGDVDAFLAVLADDCEMMPPNAKPVGGDGLRGWIAAFLDAVNVTTESYAHRVVVVAGDWAWHEYTCQWRVENKASGAVTTPRFKGLHLMRRDADGWKIVRNIWNSDPA